MLKSSRFFSAHRFPAVVMPRRPWKSTSTAPVGSSSTANFTTSVQQQPQQQSSSSTHQQDAEDERVQRLGDRVRKILHHQEVATSEARGGGREGGVAGNSTVMMPSAPQLDMVGQMMGEQQRAADEAEQLLRGSGSGGANQTSAELAWAERILGQQRQHQTSSMSREPDHDNRYVPSDARAQAMKQFLKMQQSENSKLLTTTPVCSDSRGRELLHHLSDATRPTLAQNEMSQLVDWLDSKAQHDVAVAAPQNNHHERQRSDCSSSPTTKKTENPRGMTDKERRFDVALRDTAALLEECGVDDGQWFLACGTALGCVREGRFIDHDTDIDIGVFYDPKTTTSSSGSSIHDPFLNLLSRTTALSSDHNKTNTHRKQQQCNLVCVETLGSLYYGGFQLRLFHILSGVMVDVNVYYESPVDPVSGNPTVAEPAAPGRDDAPTAVWFATFYEDAAKRRYGMYRYKFSSPISLVKRSFYGAMYNCPTEVYLEEYFGGDWRTPVKYSYEEGIAKKHYRNIVDE